MPDKIDVERLAREIVATYDADLAEFGHRTPIVLRDKIEALRAALSEPAEPTQEQIRAEFEAWIKAPPFEREPMRYPQTHATWPGSYREIQTDFAWQAWRAAYAAGRASKEQS